MNCRDFCTLLLREARKDLNKFADKKKELKGMYCETASQLASTDRYFWVKDKSGCVIWEGTSCCAYYARFQAINVTLKNMDDDYEKE